MRFAWVRRVFASWTEFGEALVLLSVCVAGVANASRLWRIIGAMVLLLLGWIGTASCSRRRGTSTRTIAGSHGSRNAMDT